MYVICLPDQTFMKTDILEILLVLRYKTIARRKIPGHPIQSREQLGWTKVEKPLIKMEREILMLWWLFSLKHSEL